MAQVVEVAERIDAGRNLRGLPVSAAEAAEVDPAAARVREQDWVLCGREAVERLDDSERTAENLPHREKYLRLVIDFLHGLLDLHEQLVDQVEHTFPGPRRQTSSPANPKARNV